MEKGIQETAEKCLRENFHIYLHKRHGEHATKEVKRSISKARGKGRRFSSLSAPWESCLCSRALVCPGKPGWPERALLRQQQPALEESPILRHRQIKLPKYHVRSPKTYTQNLST